MNSLRFKSLNAEDSNAKMIEFLTELVYNGKSKESHSERERDRVSLERIVGTHYSEFT